MKGIDGSKSWILLQEINVEGASFSASLLYVAPHDNRPYAVTFGVVGGTAYRHKARRLRHQQTIELLSQRLTGRDNIDYSESQIMDGTAVYVTAHSAGGLKRAAIYEPEAVEKGNGSSLESHRSLAKLVAKIKTTIPGPHE